MKVNRIGFVLFGCVMSAGLLANLMTGFLYKYVPSDFARTKLILETLQDTIAHKPKMVLFGNSISMSGVDANQLSKLLDNQVIYNLSSPGQLFRESFLFYTLLPKSVKEVVQFVHANELSDSAALNQLRTSTLRNFRLLGYNPQTELNNLLMQEDLEYFRKNALLVNFEARTVVKDAINQYIRRALRTDLDLNIADAELFFPNVYSTTLDSTTYFYGIQRINPKKEVTTFAINNSEFEYFVRAKAFFDSRGISYHVVVLPINFDLFNYTGQFREQVSEKIKGSLNGVPVINCINMMGKREDFYDHLHISRSGAKKFTLNLAPLLRK